jgi:protein-disulfide isomerase
MEHASKVKRLFVLSLVLTAVTLAESGPVEPGITRKQADAILEELRQLHAMLDKLQLKAPAPAVAGAAATPAPDPVHAALKLDGAVAHLGKDDAPITVVEFTDYECSYCRQFHLTAFRDIRKNYVETGKIRFYSFDLPLEFHKNARPAAAVAAHCAGEQGQFWSMRESLIGNGSRLGPDMILDIARGLYLDIPVFQTCIDRGQYDSRVQATAKQAATLSIQGTPTFVIGKSTPDGVDGNVLIGAMPYANFEAEFKKFEAQK